MNDLFDVFAHVLYVYDYVYVNWIDSDETWQTDEGSGFWKVRPSDPVKLWQDRSGYSDLWSMFRSRLRQREVFTDQGRSVPQPSDP